MSATHRYLELREAERVAYDALLQHTVECAECRASADLCPAGEGIRLTHRKALRATRSEA